MVCNHDPRATASERDESSAAGVKFLLPERHGRLFSDQQYLATGAPPFRKAQKNYALRRVARRTALFSPAPMDTLNGTCQGRSRRSLFLANDAEGVQARLIDFLHGTIRPKDFQRINVGGVAEADRHRQLALGKIAARRHHLAREGLRSDSHFDPGADSVAIAPGANQFEAQPMMSELLFVAQQQRRAVDLRHHHIQIAVAIDIRKRQAPPDDRLEDVAAAFFGRDGQEGHSFSAAIPEELGRLAILLIGLEFVDVLIKVPIGRHHVQASAQIVIEEKQAELQERAARRADPFFDRFVGENERVALLDVEAVQKFIGTPEYLEHKKKRFKSLNPNVAESGAFTIEDEKIRKQFEAEYSKTAPLYYRGLISLEKILARIQRDLARL